MAQAKILTPVFRLSFPQLFEAQSFDGGAPKFSLTMLFEGDKDLSQLEEGARIAAVARWGADKLPEMTLRTPFRDGAEKDKLDGYEAGITFVRASSSADSPPELVDRDRNPILSRNEIYAGCYCRAVVNPFAYKKAGNQGVSFGVSIVQKVADGVAFGGGGGMELLDELPADTTGAAAPAAAAGDGFLQ